MENAAQSNSAITPTPAAIHDVVIVGGGLVGASLAIALAPLGLDVVMVEATPAGELPPVFDQRNLSLAEASVNALSALGVWPLLQAATGPIKRIHVSRAGDFGQVRLDAAKHGRECFGQVVVARDFGAALEARLQQLPQLNRLRPMRCVGTHMADDGLRDVLVQAGDEDQPQRLRTRLLVAADGADSAVRSALGIHATVEDYAQTLFVTRMRSERRPDGTAFERLTDAGPTALLPRGDAHYGVVHGVDSEQAPAVAELSDAAFAQRVQEAFGWRAGRLHAAGSRSAYPLRRVVAEHLTAERAVLVGNAAQSLHPIGAQGFNLGLRDALTLAECLQAQHHDSAAMLQHYAQRRSEDRRRTLAFSDGLARFSANPSPLARMMRSVGIGAAAHSDSLQHWLVGAAMGYRGDVPALCRGAKQ